MRKKIFNIVTILLFLLSIVKITIDFIYPFSTKYDFNIYIEATRGALTGDSIYDKFYEGTPFNYPPSVFIILLPFTLLPSIPAAQIWVIFSILLFILTIYLFLNNFLPQLSIFNKIFILTMFFYSYPLRETLLFGQINLIVLFLIVAAFFIGRNDKLKIKFKYQILSGVLLGLASGFKVFPLFLLIFFLVKKQSITVVTTLIIFFSLNVVVLFFGIKLHYVWDYIYSIPSFTVPVDNSWAKITMLMSYDQSLSSFLLRYFILGQKLRFFIINLITLFVLSLVFLYWSDLRKKVKGIELDWILYGLLLLIVTIFPKNLAWQHNLIFLFPIIWYFIFRLIKLTTFLNASFFIFFFFLVSIDASTYSFIFGENPLFSFHGFFASSILLVSFFVFKYYNYYRNKKSSKLNKN